MNRMGIVQNLHRMQGVQCLEWFGQIHLYRRIFPDVIRQAGLSP